MTQLDDCCDEKFMDTSPSPTLGVEIVEQTLSNFSEETGFLSQTSLDSVPSPRTKILLMIIC